MGEKTLIAWTHHTFNIAWGCFKVSDGCKNCYADEFAGRRHEVKIFGPPATTPRRTFGEKHWAEPHKWQRAAEKANVTRLVFSSSMCDVFEDHPTIEAQLELLWPIIRATPNLHWQLLTKRPERIRQLLPKDWGNGYANVWLMTSVEDMRVAERVDHLREIPAVVRGISYEPALGSLADLNLTGIDWVIYGGESGLKFRDHDLAWPREMKARSEKEGFAFFYKQSANRFTERGIMLDGELIRNFPVPRFGWQAAPFERPDAAVSPPPEKERPADRKKNRTELPTLL